MSETTISRRAVTTALAALPVAVLPAAGLAALPEDDPIFAAIEAHRLAYAAFREALSDEPRYPERKGIKAWKERERVYGDLEESTMVALFRTRPTTAGGVAAFLHYLAHHPSGDGFDLWAIAGGGDDDIIASALDAAANALDAAA